MDKETRIFVADFLFFSLRVLTFRVLRSFVPLFCEGSQSFLLLDSSDEDSSIFTVLYVHVTTGRKLEGNLLANFP